MLLDKAHFFGNRAVLFRHRTGYHFTKTYSHTKKKNHVGQARSSVSTAIQIAYVMGCSKAVLLGMDCRRYRGFRYFWQLPGWKRPYRNDGVAIDTYKKKKDGPVESDRDLIQIKQAWQVIADNLPDDFALYNGSKLTILDHFPKVELQDYFDGKISLCNTSKGRIEGDSE